MPVSNKPKSIKNYQALNFLKSFGVNLVSTENNGHFTLGYVNGANQLGDINLDHYFLPNLGGTKESDITHLTCLFIDMDAGRLPNGKYKPLRKVQSAKKKMLAKIEEFKNKFGPYFWPTYIIETRNGFQVYWKFYKVEPVTSLTLKKWKDAEKRLCSFFKDVGADPKVLKPNQLMRVPYTFWNKKKEGMQPFYCKELLLSYIPNLSTFDLLYSNISTIQLNIEAKTNGWSNSGAIPRPVPVPASKSNFSLKLNVDTTEANEKFEKLKNTLESIETKSGNIVLLSDKLKINDNLSNTISETVDFLREIAVQFKFQNKKFTESTCLRLADELMKYS